MKILSKSIVSILTISDLVIIKNLLITKWVLTTMYYKEVLLSWKLRTKNNQMIIFCNTTPRSNNPNTVLLLNPISTTSTSKITISKDPKQLIIIRGRAYHYKMFLLKLIEIYNPTKGLCPEIFIQERVCIK